MSEYQEFTGKSVEEALRNARESFGVTGLDDLDFEILTPGSRGVLGMGAEPARIIAAPRAALGGAAPKREAAASVPLPPAPRPERTGDRGGFGDRGGSRDRDGGRGRDDRRGREGGGRQWQGGPGGPGGSGGRGDREGARPWGDRPPRQPADAPEGRPQTVDAPPAGEEAAGRDRGPRPERPDRAEPSTTETPRVERPRVDDRGRTDDRRDRGSRRDAGGPRDRSGRAGDVGRVALSQEEEHEVIAARASVATSREEIQAVDASPEALEVGREILQELLDLMGLGATVTVRDGDTSKLDVTATADEREALGALIGRKGERLSALQHLVNLMLSRRMGTWTRVLVDVEDYRGRRERQLQDLARRAAERVIETGKMLQLEPMPALERRWVHLALRAYPGVATQSIGEEPERRVVVLRREG